MCCTLWPHQDDRMTKTLSIPMDLAIHAEHMAMAYDLPDHFNKEEEKEKDASQNEIAVSEELETFLQGQEWEDEDVAIEGSFPQDENTDEGGDSISQQSTENIDDRIWSISTALFAKERSMDTFKRLYKNQPWVPFKKPQDPKTKMDEEEHALFESMYPRFNQHAKDFKCRAGVGRHGNLYEQMCI